MSRVIESYFCALCLLIPVWASDTPPAPSLSGIDYTNIHTKEPWSIHVVRFARAGHQFEIHSMHAAGKAIGLGTVSDQANLISPALGKPVAAVNGDFYKRDSTFAGDPRGLQILEGDLFSGPSGGAVFWLDALGEPHADDITPNFQITFRDGSILPFGVNDERRKDRAVLYTPALGAATIGGGGAPTEMLLESTGPLPLHPLHIGRRYIVRVAAIRHACNSPIPPDKAVLAIPRGIKVPAVNVGDTFELSTYSIPSLRGIKTALGGGPVLIRDGEWQRLAGGDDSDSFQVSSMFERHPRAAIGWNQNYFFLVEVDGRQPHLSVGMTLKELTRFMADLGCENAMNFDGGGSATLWYLGKVRNNPCDRRERELANSLIVTLAAPRKFAD